MAAKWIEALTGPLEQKKQYKQAKARLDALPDQYRTAAEAFNRYFMYYGGVTDGDTIVQMFSDLADLWERAAVDGTPIAVFVGEDPVEFAEAFAQAYGGKRWIDKERARLIESVEEAKRKESKP
jgi:DNA-binding ferritin-like protein (Dps family)